MFNFFNKKPAENLSRLTWSLSGLHCTSCAVNIDLTLEDIKGVSESKTNYAKSVVAIKYDPNQIDEIRLKKEIEKLGYTVTDASKNH